MKYRITAQEAKNRKLTKSINDIVIKEFGKDHRYYSFVQEYYVDFTKVHTKDLVRILQRLTIHNQFTDNYNMKMADGETFDRVLYLKLLSDYCGVDFTKEESSTLVLNKRFMLEQDCIIRDLRKELSTREHIPNRKQSKILRRLKAQGKYIID